MRLSNRHKAKYFNFLNTVVLLVFLGSVTAFILDWKKVRVLEFEKYLLILLPVLLIVWFYYRGRQIFEYDSDGEALNFKNRNIIPYLGKTANDEFPKYKIIKYEIVGLLLYRKLYVTITSKKKHHVILDYDISYLTKKELRDLKISLNKVVTANKEYIRTGEVKQ